MKTLTVSLSDELMEALETVCAENRMDPAAAVNEAVRRYVAVERAHQALGSSDLVSVYSEFSGLDVAHYASDESETFLS